MNDNTNNAQDGVLTCTCASCKKQGRHVMTPDEKRTYDMYLRIGRVAGRLDQLFPNIPGWIRYACLEPTYGGKTYCPKCSK